MSDFLMRLAQRQFGLAAPIEPRLPGLHAWVVDAPVLDPDLDFEHSPVGALQHEAVSSASSARASVDIFPLSVDGFSAPAPGPRPAAARVPGTHTEEKNGQTARIDNHGQLLVSASLSAGRKPDSAPRRPGAEGQAQPERGSGASFTTPWRAAREEGKAFETTSLVKRQAVQQIIAPQPLSGLQDQARQARRTMALEARFMEGAVAPVQVTIGRIEVTALSGAAPAKRAAAPRKHGMSLDDYLARRRRSEP